MCIYVHLHLVSSCFVAFCRYCFLSMSIQQFRVCTSNIESTAENHVLQDSIKAQLHVLYNYYISTLFESPYHFLSQGTCLTNSLEALRPLLQASSFSCGKLLKTVLFISNAMIKIFPFFDLPSSQFAVQSCGF